MANNPYKLENMLIRSHAHLRTIEFKAYFKATKDLHFKGLPIKYDGLSMTRMQGSRCLMNVHNLDTREHESYCVDFKTLKTERLEIKIQSIDSCFVEGGYMVLFRFFDPITIFKDLQEIGQIEFKAKDENCKNGHLIHGRWTQQVAHSVYAVDKYVGLYRIEWQDIKDGKYVKTLVKENVENFYVDGRLGLATLNKDHTLSLPSLSDVDLSVNVDSEAKWTLVTCIVRHWIVSGDRDGQAIIGSVSKQGDVISMLKLKLTANGFKNFNGIMFTGIYSLHQAYVRGRRGIILAIERDGCCHLISVGGGRLSKLQSIDSIVPLNVVKYKSFRVVTSLTYTDTKGKFVAGGWNWTKRISLKLK